MGEWLAVDAAWFFAVVGVLIVVAAAVVATRRYWLERGGGTIECGLRRLRGGGTGDLAGSAGSAGSAGERSAWQLGVVAYQRDELHWYRAFGILLRPVHVFPRRSLRVVSRRFALPQEAATLGPDRVIVEVAIGTTGTATGTAAGSDSAASSAIGGAARGAASGGHVELAMTDQALTGFLAWLEAAPPGSHLDDITLTPERLNLGYSNQEAYSKPPAACGWRGADLRELSPGSEF